MIAGIVVVLLIIGAYMVKASNAPQSEKSLNHARMARDTDHTDRKERENDKNTVEVTVKGGNYYFQPDTITVKKGSVVEIEFESLEGEHNIVIDAFNAKSDTVEAGEEDDVEFVANTAGTFEFYCGVGNHRSQGMVGTLIVE